VILARVAVLNEGSREDRSCKFKTKYFAGTGPESP
jgi:hypothetical protein